MSHLLGSSSLRSLALPERQRLIALGPSAVMILHQSHSMKPANVCMQTLSSRLFSLSARGRIRHTGLRSASSGRVQSQGTTREPSDPSHIAHQPSSRLTRRTALTAFTGLLVTVRPCANVLAQQVCRARRPCSIRIRDRTCQHCYINSHLPTGARRATESGGWRSVQFHIVQQRI